MHFKFSSKSAWGNVRFYPSNEPARLICKLAGQITFTPENIATLLELERFGGKVEVSMEDKHIRSALEQGLDNAAKERAAKKA